LSLLLPLSFYLPFSILLIYLLCCNCIVHTQ
jgi:hypothetical protein